MKKAIPVLIILILAVSVGFLILKGKKSVEVTAPPIEEESPPIEMRVEHEEESPELEQERKPHKVEKPKETPKSSPSPKPKAAKPKVPPPMVPIKPPPVKIHKELIPKNIEIVRVYYSSEITGPGTRVDFDINGSGFTQEFEKMITVESGHPKVEIQDLDLKTLNQIRGVLVIDKKAPTAVVYPQIKIQGKVVFRADRPYAMIRKGEVLNVAIIQMGDDGRTGRFRTYTNLTDKMFEKFKIMASTPVINITDISPRLPYFVDGTIRIGRVQPGDYDLMVKLGKKTIWERPGYINVERPEPESVGLIRQLLSKDGYHRPGDEAQFLIQGSGFRQRDAGKLRAKVDPFGLVQSTFTFISPGRMEMVIKVPLSANTTTYTLVLTQGDKAIRRGKIDFVVVPKNWLRVLKVDPALKPGGKSSLELLGRDLEQLFVAGIKTEVDEPGLVISQFKQQSPTKAVARIEAKKSVKPGDYWIKLKSLKGPIEPTFGSIIKVSSEN